MGRSGIFLNSGEVLWLLSIDETKLMRMVSEGEIRASHVHGSDQMKFRLADVYNARTAKFISPSRGQRTVGEFRLRAAAERLSITDEQMMSAIAWRLIPFGRTGGVTLEAPEEWLQFWAKERAGNTERWRHFLEIIARPLPKPESPQTVDKDFTKEEIVGSSDGDGVRPTGCCVALVVLALKISSVVAVGAAATSLLT